jgi:glycerophosphoryl diester phosphodiesterase
MARAQISGGVRAGMTAAAVALAGACGSAAAQNQTLWNFDAPTGGFAPVYGPGTMSVRGTGLTPAFGSASSFGLPLPTGGDTGVMRVPAFGAAQGLFVDHNAPPNGVHVGDGWVSAYTLIYDILVPQASFGRFISLFNTNLTNANDGDFFINPQGRIGHSGIYSRGLTANAWHRVAIVVGAADVSGGAAEGIMAKYVDGVLTGGHGGTGSGVSSRWALFGNAGASQGFLLFGDDNNETAQVFVSSFKFVPRRMTPEEVIALGGVHAGGADVPGPRGPALARTQPRVGVIAHRGRSGTFPENSVAAIRAALRQCVDAIETDVRLSSNNVVMHMHDGSVDRTTNFTGAASSFTMAQIEQADNGTWFDPAFAGERVPRLSRTLALARDFGGRLYLDVKVGGISAATRAGLLAAGVPASQIWMWAPSQSRVDELSAGVPGAGLVTAVKPRTVPEANALKAKGVVMIELGWGDGDINPTYAAFLDSVGLFLGTYTINDPDVLAQAIAAGVDFIETDFPELLYAIMIDPPACCEPDLNRDGELTFDDIQAFVALFNAGNARADYNADDEFTFDDIQAFVTRYNAGC